MRCSFTQHCTVEAYHYQRDRLRGKQEIKDLMDELVRRCSFNVMAQEWFGLQEGCFTGFYVLGESHLFVRNWCRQRLAIVSTMSCTSFDAQAFSDCIFERLVPKVQIRYGSAP